jgi:hypothetical protein
MKCFENDLFIIDDISLHMCYIFTYLLLFGMFFPNKKSDYVCIKTNVLYIYIGKDAKVEH